MFSDTNIFSIYTNIFSIHTHIYMCVHIYYIIVVQRQNIFVLIDVLFTIAWK